jgi:hypothetical protein
MSITQRSLNSPNVPNKALDALGFNRSRLVTAPHCAIQCDMTLDHASPYRDRGERGPQTWFVT